MLEKSHMKITTADKFAVHSLDAIPDSSVCPVAAILTPRRFIFAAEQRLPALKGIVKCVRKAHGLFVRLSGSLAELTVMKSDVARWDEMFSHYRRGAVDFFGFRMFQTVTRFGRLQRDPHSEICISETRKCVCMSVAANNVRRKSIYFMMYLDVGYGYK